MVSLDEMAAVDPLLVGGKAAALARVRQAGLPTLPGAVLTTRISELHDAGTPVAELPGLEEAGHLVAPGGEPLIVRSSSVVEDGARSSAAGRFESVVDVRGMDELRAAVARVLESRTRAGAADHPIGVLVQPLIDPELAGVFFGVDPVSGRTDRRVVTAVRGRPDLLVSGEVDGSRWLLDERGAPLEVDLRDGVEASRGLLRALADLGDRLAAVLGGPQDVEWAVLDGSVVVLQSRPVTAGVRGRPVGPLLGPGPVAETFPEPLSCLEADLWVPPLRDGLREALRLSRAVSERELRDRELVVVVDGWVATDLEVTGSVDRAGTRRQVLGWGRKLRRLRSAWRIGRLRAALPIIADDLCRRADADLETVPPLQSLSARQLIALVERGREALRSLHGHEILMGLVSNPSSSGFTGASVALRILVESRRDGLEDPEILRRSPEVLALVPPRVGASIDLPGATTAPELIDDLPDATDVQVRREALRMRVRWMQELVGQAATELGIRLAARGVLEPAEQVRHLRFDELCAIVADGAVELAPTTLEQVAARAAHPPGPALPARFRLSDRGLPIVTDPIGGSGGGTGAGGGTGRGVVSHDAVDPPQGAVLVVTALSPRLAPMLPRLRGIVSETGSVLSHLAILARESGVPTVVGHHGAVAELRQGATVTVDGLTGHVTIEEEP